MTYGEIKLQLSKLLPGIDPELVEGWIQGRYQRILDTIPWKRQEGESVLQAPASYAIGTLTVTQGSNVVTSDGTTPTVFTAAMNGLMIRIAAQAEYYQFTYVSPTVGNLDRGYEGPDATAATYRIDQAIYLLPTNCRIVRQVRPFHNDWKPLELVSPAELNRIRPSRNYYGTPRYACPTWDNSSDPPQMQLELYPVPDVPDTSSTLLSWGVDYIFEEAELDRNGSGVTLKPFARPAAIFAGVQSDAMRPRPTLDGHLGPEQVYDAESATPTAQSLMNIQQQRGPPPIRLTPHLPHPTPATHRKPATPGNPNNGRRPWNG